jgi:peptide/nickel transport system permease protein
MTAASTSLQGPARWRTAARGLLGRPDLCAALVILTVVAIATIAPGLIATTGPTTADLAVSLKPPSSAHWFGTDEIGRDLYSRVVYGARQSLLIGVGAAGVSLSLAIVLGSLAALAHRWVAFVVDRVIEVFFAFPTLLMALLVVAVLGSSAMTLVIAIGVGAAPGYARIVRGQVLSVKVAGYVEAAVELGHRPSRILRRHIVPNALRPLVAIFALAVGQQIVWASGLAFLGLGVAPPSSEWGALLDAGRRFTLRAPWLTIFPGLLIVVLALALTTVGKNVRDFFEKGTS